MKLFFKGGKNESANVQTSYSSTNIDSFSTKKHPEKKQKNKEKNRKNGLIPIPTNWIRKFSYFPKVTINIWPTIFFSFLFPEKCSFCVVSGVNQFIEIKAKKQIFEKNNLQRTYCICRDFKSRKKFF